MTENKCKVLFKICTRDDDLPSSTNCDQGEKKKTKKSSVFFLKPLVKRYIDNLKRKKVILHIKS